MKTFILQIALVLAFCSTALAQPKAPVKLPTEADYYPMVAFDTPKETVMEAGGLEMMPDGKLAVGTRRGEVWMITNPAETDPAKMKYQLWASGLHEILGLAKRDGWLYICQRPEITRAKDLDGDGRADLFETVNDKWEISGDYHEYNMCSKFDKDGNLWVVLCLTGSFSSNVPYRGWCVRVSHDGKLIPTASGIRSPGGIGFGPDGEVFYCDNQGPWNGTSGFKNLRPGSFQSHPDGLKWFDLPEIKATLGDRPVTPKTKSRFHVEKERIPQYIPPTNLVPHGKLGNSASGVEYDNTGKFGPFKGQMFISDQSFSQVNRVFLEKVNDTWQSAVFCFRTGFGSGNVPMLFDKDGSLYVGGTNRGWGSRGNKQGAVDRVYWNGKTPFEVHEMRIKPDGFELTFTQPIDKATVADIKSYSIKTYTYIMQADYGSPEVDATTPTIKGIKLGADGKSARLTIDGLVIGSVHELAMPGIRSAQGLPLLHNTGYYTLWNLPKELTSR
jgi:hypothetical protein